ncbi:helix-turn-helix domain-containing protein [Allosalinactinospora lopnorensis]|uniref:helix-turn-helix domain-containing protein n=1 Tax=Allosalinactinospora lopnorensis TaxID=1352348 RepID=UPI001F0277C1|nr:helix-turn-helix domain-containing protein [Allosalinactinospora lopnorensis]
MREFSGVIVAQQQLDTALPAGTDPREYARLLHRVHEATFSGGVPPARPRPVIADSWERVRRLGIDPDRRAPAPVLRKEEIEQRRNTSPLLELLPMLRSSLVSVAEDAGHVMLITDEKGRILWREGPSSVRRIGDGLGLVEGAAWEESVAGTNGIGTALVVDRPLQVYSAEHYLRGLHPLTCSCAPIHDPRDGKLVGAIDLSGAAVTAHPSTLGLVNATAQLAESQLRCVHHAHLERLRVVAAPLLAKLREKALVVDENGWTAAVAHMDPVRRVLLPKRPEAGNIWLPVLGECRMEPLPGGWLLRPIDTEPAPATHVVLDLTHPSEPSLSVTSQSGEWTRRLTSRHAELLFLLSCNREGRSAAQLAADLFGDQDREVTVRAEMSRLRRHLGGVVQSRPYRFNEKLLVSVRGPEDAAALLPGSCAPAIRRLRGDLAGQRLPG